MRIIVFLFFYFEAEKEFEEQNFSPTFVFLKRQVVIKIYSPRNQHINKHQPTTAVHDKNGHAEQKRREANGYRRFRSRVQAENRGSIQSGGESEKLFKRRRRDGDGVSPFSFTFGFPS